METDGYKYTKNYPIVCASHLSEYTFCLPTSVVFNMMRSVGAGQIKDNLESDQPWCVRQAPPYFVSCKWGSWKWTIKALLASKTTVTDVKAALRRFPTLQCNEPFTKIDVEVPSGWLLHPERDGTFNTFILNWGNTNTKIHVEEECFAGLVQLLVGEKTWKLWKPGVCPLDRLDMLPDFIFQMKVGDMLLVPSGWWHSVETTAGAVLVGNSFRNSNSVLAFSKCFSGINNHGHETLLEVVHEMKDVCQNNDVFVPKKCLEGSIWSTSKTLASSIRKHVVISGQDKNTRRSGNGNIRRGKAKRVTHKKNVLSTHAFSSNRVCESPSL
jgi:hypothetical protein